MLFMALRNLLGTIWLALPWSRKWYFRREMRRLLAEGVQMDRAVELAFDATEHRVEFGL